MTTVDAYLKALLTLSGDEQLADARPAPLKSINKNDLVEVVKKGVGREFARGGLEDIASVILDVVARDPAFVGDNSAHVLQASEVKEEAGSGSISRGAEPEATHPSSGSILPATGPVSRTRKRSFTSSSDTEDGVKVSLRCQTEQVIANKTVPPIGCSVSNVP